MAFSVVYVHSPYSFEGFVPIINYHNLKEQDQGCHAQELALPPLPVSSNADDHLKNGEVYPNWSSKGLTLDDDLFHFAPAVRNRDRKPLHFLKLSSSEPAEQMEDLDMDEHQAVAYVLPSADETPTYYSELLDVLAHPNSSVNTQEVEVSPQYVYTGSPCSHVSSWTRVRTKRHYIHYKCDFCGCRWRSTKSVEAQK
jgi:hypothetical protein